MPICQQPLFLCTFPNNAGWRKCQTRPSFLVGVVAANRYYPPDFHCAVASALHVLFDFCLSLLTTSDHAIAIAICNLQSLAAGGHVGFVFQAPLAPYAALQLRIETFMLLKAY